MRLVIEDASTWKMILLFCGLFLAGWGLGFVSGRRVVFPRNVRPITNLDDLRIKDLTDEEGEAFLEACGLFGPTSHVPVHAQDGNYTLCSYCGTHWPDMTRPCPARELGR